MNKVQVEKNRLISVDYYIYFFLYHKIIKDSNDWCKSSCCSRLIFELIDFYSVKKSKNDEEVIEDILL